MSRDRVILALLLALLGGLFLADLLLLPGGVLPAAVYGVPTMLASWSILPVPVAIVATAACVLLVVSRVLEGIRAETIAFDFAALALLGILAVALSVRVQRERELRRRASREREEFRFLTENTRDIIFRLDLFPTPKYSYVSPSISDVLGYTPPEVYADPNLSERFVLPDDLPELQQSITNPRADQMVTFRARHRDGHIVWLEQRNVAIVDREGRRVGIEGVARDITERKIAEQELLQATAELEAVFRALPDMFLRLDSEDRVIDYKVSQGTHLFAPAESMSGTRVEDVLPPSAALPIADTLTRVRQSKQLVTVEYTLPFPDGERVYESRILPFLGDQVIAVVRDVTDRAELLAELTSARETAEREAARLDATFHSMADAVVIYDSTGAILRSNAAADRLFGYSPEDRNLPIERRLALLGIMDEEGKPFPIEQSPSWLALRGQTVTGVTVVAHPPTQKTVWLSASAAPIRDAAGELLGAVATFTDITALHELQERLRDIIRSLSHDLRNPLTAVLGQSQIIEMMLQKSQADEGLLNRAHSVVAGARRMSAIITQLTEATRIESGQLQVNTQRLDIAILLSDFLANSIHSLDVERVVLEAPPNLPTVVADPVHVERVVANLLSNALKYSAPGTPVVLRAEETDGFVKVSVIDQGPGIAAEELQRLFDRFYRARRTASAEGLGIGLYISKALVEAQGGALSVESKVGAGSAFAFTLPVETAVSSP